MEIDQSIMDAVLLVSSVLMVRYLLIFLETLAQKDPRFWYLKMLTLVVTVLCSIVFIDAFKGDFFNTVFVGLSGIYFVFKGESLGRKESRKEEQ